MWLSRGNSNDGNAARQTFENEGTTDDILKVDKSLIERLHVMMTALSSGYEIDPSKFKTYCMKTAELYASLHPWYYMPQNLPTILFHGHHVIENMSLPIGLVTEEAQEAMNKVFKKYREHLPTSAHEQRPMKIS